jgi:hypothetical protein
MNSTYKCEACGGVFDKVSTVEETDAEALSLFGVENASQCLGEDGDMATVCDDCWRKMGCNELTPL